jgi:hypothetical protein
MLETGRVRQRIFKPAAPTLCSYRTTGITSTSKRGRFGVGFAYGECPVGSAIVGRGRVISALLLLGALAFGVSGLFFAVSTYKVAKDRDWEAASIGIALTGICLLFGGGLVLLLILRNR